MRRAKWVRASLGRKRGAGQVLALLPAGEDLPGEHWRKLDERTWRTGETDATPAWAQRARDIGSVTAWRSFESDDHRRWLWTQVSPLASAEDAAAAMADISTRLLRNLRADVAVVEDRDVSPPTLDGVSTAWAHEQLTTGPRGDAVARYLAFAASRVVGVVSESGDRRAGAWADVELVASFLVRRIQDVVDE